MWIEWKAANIRNDLKSISLQEFLNIGYDKLFKIKSNTAEIVKYNPSLRIYFHLSSTLKKWQIKFTRWIGFHNYFSEEEVVDPNELKEQFE